jgi:hypothetical protein
LKQLYDCSNKFGGREGGLFRLYSSEKFRYAGDIAPQWQLAATTMVSMRGSWVTQLRYIMNSSGLNTLIGLTAIHGRFSVGSTFLVKGDIAFGSGVKGVLCGFGDVARSVGALFLDEIEQQVAGGLLGKVRVVGAGG